MPQPGGLLLCVATLMAPPAEPSGGAADRRRLSQQRQGSLARLCPAHKLVVRQRGSLDLDLARARADRAPHEKRHALAERTSCEVPPPAPPNDDAIGSLLLGRRQADQSEAPPRLLAGSRISVTRRTRRPRNLNAFACSGQRKHSGEEPMHPTIERYMMKAWITDLHRQAERNRMACAASRTPRTRREKRKAEPHARSHGRSRAPRAHHEPQRACPMADAMIARPGCQPYPCSPTVTSGPEGRVRERAAMLAIRAAACSTASAAPPIPATSDLGAVHGTMRPGRPPENAEAARRGAQTPGRCPGVASRNKK